MDDSMKKWKDFLLKEENELAVVDNSSEIEAEKGDLDVLREYLQEIQNMAMRIMEMEQEIKDRELSYYPGYEFRNAAKQLADAEEFGSLANRISKWISNETRMKTLKGQLKK
jgi:hypothetical protein|tara:strand:- start:10 stop:345 length:336 start_codon:yes stop_codon:yes gene_type:complete